MTEGVAEREESARRGEPGDDVVGAADEDARLAAERASMSAQMPARQTAAERR